MRQWVWMGASLLLLEIGGYTVERFSTAWMALHLMEALVISIGFLLIARRMAKLEAKVGSQRKRLDSIAGLVGWMIDGDERDGANVERVLRSVS